MDSKLTRESVETQVQEMWQALADIPSNMRDNGYDQAVTKAHAIEADLRGRLRKQEALEAAAPLLYDACKEVRLMLNTALTDYKEEPWAERLLVAIAAAEKGD